MAAISKGDIHDEQLRTIFRGYLQKLGWPELDCIEDWSILNLLFTPSPARTCLIEWILDKWNFSSSGSFETIENDSEKFKYLIDCISALGICKPSEIDVIEGSASRKRQISFWKFLLSMTVSRCNTIHSQLSFSEDNENSALQDQAFKNASFLESIAQNMTALQPLLDLKVELVSSDIRNFINKKEKDQNQNPSRFTEDNVKNELSLLKSKISSEQSDLDKLKRSAGNETNETAKANDAKGMLKNALLDLDQLSRIYKYTHDEEISQWLKKDDNPKFSELGETFQLTTNSLGRFTSALPHVNTIKEECQSLREFPPKDLKSKTLPTEKLFNEVQKLQIQQEN